MNVGEAHAVDKALSALARITLVNGLRLRDGEQAAVDELRERAAKALQVTPDAIGKAAFE